MVWNWPLQLSDINKEARIAELFTLQFFLYVFLSDIVLTVKFQKFILLSSQL